MWPAIKCGSPRNGRSKRVSGRSSAERRGHLADSHRSSMPSGLISGTVASGASTSTSLKPRARRQAPSGSSLASVRWISRCRTMSASPTARL
eukprot:4114902-Prymnesium_polylepis.3